jgi:Na+/melibiose symporter-like transporter
LGAELATDYQDRTSLTGLRGIVAMLGTLIASALVFVVFFPNTTPGVDPKLAYEPYPVMGGTIGLIMSVSALIATFGTYGLIPRLPVDSDPQPAHDTRSFFSEFVTSFRNRSFRIMFVSCSLFYWGVVINTALALHFFTYYAMITDSRAISLFQVAFYLGGSLGVVGWMLLARRMEKKTLYIAAALGTALISALAYLLIGAGRPLGTGDPLPLLIGHAIGGALSSILWFMPWSMVADIADEDEAKTGRRREGSLTGLFFFGQQLASGLSVLLTGVLLEWFAGLVPGDATQSALTGARIGMLYGILPALLIVAAAALALRYQLGRAEVAALQTEPVLSSARLES